MASVMRSGFGTIWAEFHLGFLVLPVSDFPGIFMIQGFGHWGGHECLGGFSFSSLLLLNLAVLCFVFCTSTFLAMICAQRGNTNAYGTIFAHNRI